MFGLEGDEQVPAKLLEHVTGGLLADCLEEAATSCGWTDFFESDKSVQAVFAAARDHLRTELKTEFAREMAAAHAATSGNTGRASKIYLRTSVSSPARKSTAFCVGTTAKTNVLKRL